MVRRIKRKSCTNLSFRIDSFSNIFKNRNVLKSMVIILLLFNKWMSNGMAVNGSSQRKKGINKLTAYLPESG